MVREGVTGPSGSVDNPVSPSATAQLPSACTLGLDDGGARLRRWAGLAARRLSTARSPDGERLEVRYADGPAIRAELEALAAAERECCAFAQWTVAGEGDQLVLRVTATSGRPDGIAALAALLC